MTDQEHENLRRTLEKAIRAYIRAGGRDAETLDTLSVEYQAAKLKTTRAVILEKRTLYYGAGRCPFGEENHAFAFWLGYGQQTTAN